jgi:hypothetical protein
VLINDTHVTVNEYAPPDVVFLVRATTANGKSGTAVIDVDFDQCQDQVVLTATNPIEILVTKNTGSMVLIENQDIIDNFYT